MFCPFQPSWCTVAHAEEMSGFSGVLKMKVHFYPGWEWGSLTWWIAMFLLEDTVFWIMDIPVQMVTSIRGVWNVKSKIFHKFTPVSHCAKPCKKRMSVSFSLSDNLSNSVKEISCDVQHFLNVLHCANFIDIFNYLIVLSALDRLLTNCSLTIMSPTHDNVFNLLYLPFCKNIFIMQFIIYFSFLPLRSSSYNRGWTHQKVFHRGPQLQHDTWLTQNKTWHINQSS